jgi:hypothetical protein
MGDGPRTNALSVQRLHHVVRDAKGTAALLFLLAGCGERPAVVATNPPAAVPLRDTIDIALPDSIPRIPLTLVRSIDLNPYRTLGGRWLAKGRIGLSDPHNIQVNILDTMGNRLRTIGRRGRGPGEFELLIWYGPVGDQILVLGTNNVARFTLDGDLVANAILEQPRIEAYGASLIGVRGDGATVTERYDATGPHAPGRLHSGRWNGQPHSTVIVHRPDGGLESLWRPKFEANYVVTSHVDFHVWLPERQWAFDDSTLYLTEGEEFIVRTFSMDGKPRRVYRFMKSPRATTREDRDHYNRRYLESAQDTAAARQALRRLTYAPHLPAFIRLLVDDRGNLWLREGVPSSRDPQSWLVVERTGRILGTVVLPETFWLNDVRYGMALAGGKGDDGGVLNVYRVSLPAPR